MRTIIAGSRSIETYDLLCHTIKNCGWEITTVLSGGASGVDKLGERWAKENNVPLEVYPAEWRLGPYAGHKRNQEMVDKAEAIIVLWDGESQGTKDVIFRARRRMLHSRIMLLSKEAIFQ